MSAHKWSFGAAAGAVVAVRAFGSYRTPVVGRRSTPKVDTTSIAQRVDDPLLEDRPGTAGSRSETGDAIVVGAIDSAAPWFLTGWTHEVEIEFMIDTGVHWIRKCAPSYAPVGAGWSQRTHLL